jgi:hypothetical protein
MVGVTENYSKFEVHMMVRYLQAGMRERVTFTAVYSVFMARMFSAERQCLCDATNLKMAERN